MNSEEKNQPSLNNNGASLLNIFYQVLKQKKKPDWLEKNKYGNSPYNETPFVYYRYKT